MPDTLKAILAGIAGFIVLDGIWLGVVMSGFYKEQLAPIARLSSSGAFAPDWTAAGLVYVLLGAGVALFAAPRADSVLTAAAAGALFGLVVYGVYDLTNFATLKAWPMAVVVADICWGMAASAACTVAAHLVTRP
jgi:uncharacterized membrane protein